MKKISRKQAEKLFQNSGVVKSNVEHIDHALYVRMTLGNGDSFLMQYDTKKQHKSYFIEQQNQQLPPIF